MSAFDAAALQRAATRHEIGAEARDEALAAAVEAVVRHLDSAERAALETIHMVLAFSLDPAAAERRWTRGESLMAVLREGIQSLSEAVD